MNAAAGRAAQSAAGTAEVAVLAAPRRFAFVAQAPEAPGDGELRVRIDGCGVCASSIPVWEGRPWFRHPLPPGRPGHEAWGTVEACGAGVGPALRPGTPVALLHEAAYASHVRLPAARAVPLPEALAGRPFPGEAIGCALNAFRRADVRPRQQVAVVGAGFLGLLLVQLCVQAGARVAAISRRACSRAAARRFGADPTLPVDAPDTAREAIAAWTGGRGCERVFEATGLQDPLTLAASLCGVRARLVIAGYHQEGRREIDLQLWNWRGLDVVNAHERARAERLRGMREAAAAVARGRLDPWPLLTDGLPFARIDDAFARAAARPAGFVKAWVAMGATP